MEVAVPDVTAGVPTRPGTRECTQVHTRGRGAGDDTARTDPEGTRPGADGADRTPRAQERQRPRTGRARPHCALASDRDSDSPVLLPEATEDTVTCN